MLAATPSVWPVRGYLSSTFGNRIDPFTGQSDFHPGIDISTPIGTKVQAPADGVVVSRGVKGSYGNAIVIDHGYGVVTRYAHLSGIQREARAAGSPRRRHRLRRADRPVDRSPPPLRGLGARPAPESHPLHPRRVPHLRLDPTRKDVVRRGLTSSEPACYSGG